MKWEERVGWALPVPPSVVRVVLRGRARMGDNENSVTSLATELRRERRRDEGGRGRDRGAPLDWANKHSCLVGRRSEEEQGGKGGAGEEGHVVTTCTSYALLSLSTVTS